MSGEPTHNNHCRIGKVTLKPKVIEVDLHKRAPGRVRGLFVEAIEAIDLNAERGIHPIVGFFGMVHADGTVNIVHRMNKEPTSDTLAKLNWRNLTMLFEDMAQDCRNFSNYHQQTTYDLVNEVLAEGNVPEESGYEEVIEEEDEDLP